MTARQNSEKQHRTRTLCTYRVVLLAPVMGGLGAAWGRVEVVGRMHGRTRRCSHMGRTERESFDERTQRPHRTGEVDEGDDALGHGHGRQQKSGDGGEGHSWNGKKSWWHRDEGG